MFRHAVILLAGAVWLGGCINKTDKQSTDQYVKILTKPDVMPKQFTISNRSLYANLFIDSLRKASYPGSMELKGDYIVVSKDTTRFPQDLRLNVAYHFTGIKDSLQYLLMLQRVNLTTVNFVYQTKQGKAAIAAQSGSATLSPLFFLATEPAEDTAGGGAYATYPYTALLKGGQLSIHIGIGRDAGNRLRVFISSNRSNYSSPLLRTKEN